MSRNGSARQFDFIGDLEREFNRLRSARDAARAEIPDEIANPGLTGPGERSAAGGFALARMFGGGGQTVRGVAGRSSDQELFSMAQERVQRQLAADAMIQREEKRRRTIENVRDLLPEGTPELARIEAINVFLRQSGFEPFDPDREDFGVLEEARRSIVRETARISRSVTQVVNGTLKALGVPEDSEIAKVGDQIIQQLKFAEEVEAPSREAQLASLSDPEFYTSNLPGIGVQFFTLFSGAGVGGGVARALGAGKKLTSGLRTVGSLSPMAALEGVAAYDQAKDAVLRSGGTEDEAERIALIEGATYAAVSTLLERFGIAELAIKTPAVRRALVDRARNGVLAGVREAGTEASQTFAQDMISGAMDSREFVLSETARRAVDSAVLGFAAGGPVGVVAGRRIASETQGDQATREPTQAAETQQTGSDTPTIPQPTQTESEPNDVELINQAQEVLQGAQSRGETVSPEAQQAFESARQSMLNAQPLSRQQRQALLAVSEDRTVPEQQDEPGRVFAPQRDVDTAPGQIRDALNRRDIAPEQAQRLQGLLRRVSQGEGITPEEQAFVDQIREGQAPQAGETTQDQPTEQQQETAQVPVEPDQAQAQAVAQREAIIERVDRTRVGRGEARRPALRVQASQGVTVEQVAEQAQVGLDQVRERRGGGFIVDPLTDEDLLESSTEQQAIVDEVRQNLERQPAPETAPEPAATQAVEPGPAAPRPAEAAAIETAQPQVQPAQTEAIAPVEAQQTPDQIEAELRGVGFLARGLNQSDRQELVEISRELNQRAQNVARTGFDPTLIPLAVRFGRLLLRGGVRRFTDFARAMVRRFGEGVRPELRRIFRESRAVAGEDIIDQVEDDAAVSDEALEQAIQQEISRDATSDFIGRVGEAQARVDQNQPASRTRPDLANPGRTPEAQAAIGAVDDVRTEAGQPERLSRAQQRILGGELTQSLGLDGVEAQLLQDADELRGPDSSLRDSAKNAAYQDLVNHLHERATEEGTPEAWIRFAAATDALRELRGEAGRVLGSGHLLQQNPAMRLLPREMRMRVVRHQMAQEFMSIPVARTQRAIKRVNRQIREAKGEQDAERERELKDRRLRLYRREGKKLAEANERIKAQGYDPAEILNTDENGLPTDPRLDDHNKVLEFGRLAQAAKEWEWSVFYEWWRNAILSGPQTPGINVLSGALFAPYELVVRRLTEATINLVRQDPNAVTFGELLETWRVFAPAIAHATRSAMAAWKYERLIFEEQINVARVAEGKQTIRQQSKLDQEVPAGSIPGQTGRKVRSPQRALLFGDEFIRASAGHMIAHGFAYRIARNEGLKGEARARRANELFNDLSSDAWAQAALEAQRLVFVDQPSPVGRVALEVRRAAPPTAFIVPFITTIDRIFIRAGEMTPLAPVLTMERAARAGMGKLGVDPDSVVGYRWRPGQGVRETANNVLAFGVGMVGLALLVDEDDLPRIAGSSPIDLGERGLAFRTIPPGHIRIGDRLVNYGRVEPFGTAMMAWVDTLWAWRNAADGEQMTEAIKASMLTFRRQANDKTFMRNISDTIDLLDPRSDDFGDVELYATRFAASWVPNLVRQPLREASPTLTQSTRVVGEDQPFWTRATARLRKEALPYPGQNPPRINLWGEEIDLRTFNNPAGDFLFRALSPIDVRRVSSRDPDALRLDQMLLRLQEELPDEPLPRVPSNKIRRRVGDRQVEITLSAEEYTQFLRDSGAMALNALKNVQFDPENPKRRDLRIIRTILQRSRRHHRDQILRERLRSGEVDR